MDGVTFGTKHSYRDFGLILSSKDISLPKPKTKTVEVPGALVGATAPAMDRELGKIYKRKVRGL